VRPEDDMARSYDGMSGKMSANWQNCSFCMEDFKKIEDFTKHLRDRHCTVEGGSFVCRYGYNNVCSSLPVDGISSKDYDAHIAKYHVAGGSKEAEVWSVFSNSPAQNLPAVLNDPSKGKQSNFFTKKWGVEFVEKTPIHHSPFIPDIKWEHFDLYIRKIGKRYKRHKRFETLPNPDHPSSPKNSISDTVGRLDDIPGIFFKSDIELHHPGTFAQVFPGINETTTGRLLQEKLSHYLDIVEIHIAKQVTRKSSAFFHAMTSQDAIMEEMNVAATNVIALREKLKQIDRLMVRQGMKLIQLQQVKSNKTLVLDKLKLMVHVHKTQPTIQLLLGTQDYVAALDLISATQDILAKELVGVHCFKNLPSQLQEIDRLIDKMLATEFQRYSTADLNRPLVGIDDRVLDEDKLICVVSGLLRKKNFTFVDSYKDEAITAIRALIKELLINLIATTDAEICLTGAGEEAQILSVAEWIWFLETAIEKLLKLLRRVKLVTDIMLQTADMSAGKFIGNEAYCDSSETFLSTEHHKQVETKLIDLLLSVCNYCHERCANLVSNQSVEKYVATTEEMQKLVHLVEAFCIGCEEISGVQSVPLKGALKAHGTRFAQKFHNDRKSKLAQLLDSERWKQADVPAEFQRIIDNISQHRFDLMPDEGSSTASPVLIVDGQSYALVGSAVLLVQIVSEYCRCASQLPLISAQLSRNVVDLLRTFNSRCCQLVLGAGALHVAGLKTITSVNLALVSRALQLVIWLLPFVRSHFQGIDKNGNSINGNIPAPAAGYEAVERDFISHVSELESKVLSIVGQIIQTQLATWEAKPPIPSQAFRNITRQFIKLYEAIAPILPESQISTIFRTVHKNFKDKLRERLLEQNITNDGGPQQGVVISELTFYAGHMQKLNAMPADELAEDMLKDIWLS